MTATLERSGLAVLGDVKPRDSLRSGLRAVCHNHCADPNQQRRGSGLNLFNRSGSIAETAAISLLYLILFQAWGALLGQDVGWDQANYHLSSVYLWLHDRPWADYAVSQQQSWFNPLPEFPAYLIVTGLPARWAAIALAALPVLNAAALWSVVRRFVFPQPGLAPFALALGCTLVGLTGTIHLFVVATTMAEAWMPSLVLMSLYALLASAEGDRASQARWLACGGLLLGLAIGMKPTNAPFGFGAAALLVVGCGTARNLAAHLLVFGAAGLLGVALGGGWWIVHLWSTYGDPAFPMFSRGGSTWLGVDALSHEQFRREHWWQLFVDPFLLAVGDHSRVLSTVMPVRDARYLVGFYSAIAIILLQLRAHVARQSPDEQGARTAFFFLVSYVVWVAAFNIDRYAIPLELLAPAVAGILFRQLGGIASRRALGVYVLVLASVLLGSRPIKSFRAPFARDWIGLTIPAGIAAPDTLYVMTGYDHLAWLTLFEQQLGGGAAFVRVAGNLRIDPDRKLGQRIAALIEGHAGPIRSLTGPDELPSLAADLKLFGLAPISGSCRVMTARLGDVTSCALRRIPAAAVPASPPAH